MIPQAGAELETPLSCGSTPSHSCILYCLSLVLGAKPCDAILSNPVEVTDDLADDLVTVPKNNQWLWHCSLASWDSCQDWSKDTCLPLRIQENFLAHPTALLRELGCFQNFKMDSLIVVAAVVVWRQGFFL